MRRIDRVNPSRNINFSLEIKSNLTFINWNGKLGFHTAGFYLISYPIKIREQLSKEFGDDDFKEELTVSVLM